MILKNPYSNLIEQSQYKYSLQDVDEPNLYREIYPYDEIPKVAFNHRHVPLAMPNEIWITDTTFRDGQQSRAPYTSKQIVDMYKMMHRLGGERGLIRQSEFFVYTKKDLEAVEKCMALGYEFPEITTWIRAKKEDFELVHNLGIKETGILVSCSDYHIFKKLGLSRSEALEHYLGVVKRAIDAGIRPRCHLEDITRADFYGFVVPFVNALGEVAKEANIPLKIRMCDTLGYGVSYPGVALPRSVPGIVYGLRHYADIPSEMLEWHGHNDFYHGVTNAVSAWLYGASAVNCSLFGVGERTGNIPIEAMVIEYAALRGTFDGMNPEVITELAEYYTTELNYDIPPMTPFVGANFNVTRAGIHADGLMKDTEIYNIFDTEKILGRKAEVAVSNTSGLAGVAYWMNKHYSSASGEDYTKHDDIVIKVKEMVDREYSDGRTTLMGDDELIAFTESADAGMIAFRKRQL
ncbi:MAG: 2-isopropylmalate synthase [Clostridia bacterium]|nr:2-isopropylmalate synthase [Clostridia bacterium]